MAGCFAALRLVRKHTLRSSLAMGGGLVRNSEITVVHKSLVLLGVLDRFGLVGLLPMSSPFSR